MIVKIVTENKGYHKKLMPYAPYIRGMLEALGKQYRFKYKLPKNIILRPLKKSTSFNRIPCSYAVAGYSAETGKYYISVDMDYFKYGKRFILFTLAHEVAHIAEALKINRWTHRELFKEMYNYAKKWVKDNEGVK